MTEASISNQETANTQQNSVAEVEDPQPTYDEEEELESDFVQKYGPINVVYIKRPKQSRWLMRPHALNYFHNGVLYRTSGERSSGKIELYFDLTYVGIVSILASDATDHASAAAFLKYVLLFQGAYTIWADVKEFMNYYFNDDLSQRLYILWIICLLIVFTNSSKYVLDDVKSAAAVVVPYIICRLSFAISIWVYSIYVHQHRLQMRLYGTLVTITSLLFLIVIFVRTRAKIGVSVALYFLDVMSFIMSFHPYIKKVLSLEYSTAINIEHEVDRYGSFYIIAIGEFLAKVVSNSDLGSGIHVYVWRAIMVAVISYVFMWLYFNGDGSQSAIHALRRSAFSATTWFYAHLLLIGSMILTADSAGELIASKETSTAKHHAEATGGGTEELTVRETSEEEEVSMYAVAFFFCGGICVVMIALTVLALLDKPLDSPQTHYAPQIVRVGLRIPVGIIVLCLAFAEMSTTRLIGITMMLLVILFVYELIIGTPRKQLKSACKIATKTNRQNRSDMPPPGLQNTLDNRFSVDEEKTVG
ncbi:bacterial low temperature requirement A protein-domain-containing protein [Dipodascopsis uninucleata]